MEKNIIQQDLYRIYGKSLKEVSFFERIFIETNPVVKCQKLFRKFVNAPYPVPFLSFEKLR